MFTMKYVKCVMGRMTYHEEQVDEIEFTANLVHYRCGDFWDIFSYDITPLVSFMGTDIVVEMVRESDLDPKNWMPENYYQTSAKCGIADKEGVGVRTYTETPWMMEHWDKLYKAKVYQA